MLGIFSKRLSKRENDLEVVLCLYADALLWCLRKCCVARRIGRDASEEMRRFTFWRKSQMGLVREAGAPNARNFHRKCVHEAGSSSLAGGGCGAGSDMFGYARNILEAAFQARKWFRGCSLSLCWRSSMVFAQVLCCKTDWKRCFRGDAQVHFLKEVSNGSCARSWCAKCQEFP